MQLQPRVGGRVQASPFHSRVPVARQQQCRRRMASVTCTAAPPEQQVAQRPDKTGRFGRFGGKYVPETLISALAELEQAYHEAMNDPEFKVGLAAIGVACCRSQPASHAGT